MNYGRRLRVLRSHGMGRHKKQTGRKQLGPDDVEGAWTRISWQRVREVPTGLRAPTQEWGAAVDKETDLGLSGSLDGS